MEATEITITIGANEYDFAKIAFSAAKQVNEKLKSAGLNYFLLKGTYEIFESKLVKAQRISDLEMQATISFEPTTIEKALWRNEIMCQTCFKSKGGDCCDYPKHKDVSVLNTRLLRMLGAKCIDDKKNWFTALKWNERVFISDWQTWDDKEL